MQFYFQNFFLFIDVFCLHWIVLLSCNWFHLILQDFAIFSMWLQTDGQMDQWTDRPTDGWTNGWSNGCTMFLLYRNAIDASWNVDFTTDFAIFTKALRTDQPTDRRTDKPSYRDVMMYAVRLSYRLEQDFARKCWFPLFFTKAWRTDRPSYGDARTHLNKAHKANDASSCWRLIDVATFIVLYHFLLAKS